MRHHHQHCTCSQNKSAKLDSGVILRLASVRLFVTHRIWAPVLCGHWCLTEDDVLSRHQSSDSGKSLAIPDRRRRPYTLHWIYCQRQFDRLNGRARVPVVSSPVSHLAWDKDTSLLTVSLPWRNIVVVLRSTALWWAQWRMHECAWLRLHQVRE